MLFAINIYDMWAIRLMFCLLLSACLIVWRAPSSFQEVIVNTNKFDIFTYQKISDSTSAVHIYIEGDGYAFNGAGQPTSDSTPRNTFLRELSARDTHPNVVYMARPCQYIKSSSCRQSDWTIGRFSAPVIDSMASAIKQIAQNRPIILIGYSGGAMVSGLVILRNPDLRAEQWITIAGVLNHSDWTAYFGDTPLTQSLDMYELPHINQIHYISDGDKVVPNSLSYKWTVGKELKTVLNSTHSRFPELKINFDLTK